MKALTIWQPWASLIMVGAKPYEFRGWSFADRPGGRELIGQQIVIHAGARPVHQEEVAELLLRLDRSRDDGIDHGTGLIMGIARELLVRVHAAHSTAPILPLRCGLGTAVLERPRKSSHIFKGPRPGGYEINPAGTWAWPLSDIRPFDAPVPARGMQGFWHWELGQQAA